MTKAAAGLCPPSPGLSPELLHIGTSLESGQPLLTVLSEGRRKSHNTPVLNLKKREQRSFFYCVKRAFLQTTCMASGFLQPALTKCECQAHAGEQKEPALLHPPLCFCTCLTAKGKQNMEINVRIQTQKGTRNRHEAPLLFKFYIKLVASNCPLSNTS